MSAPKNRPGRAFARIAAAVGAAALGAGAFALPASAQAPVPVAVDLDVASEVVADNEHHRGGLTIEFGDDFAEGEHEVTADIDLDTDDDSGLILLPTYDWDGCGMWAETGQFLCIAEDADNPVEFAFQYKALVGAVEGVYDYTVTIAVDGETVETLEGAIEVLPAEAGSAQPYGHAPVILGSVEPGETVDVQPTIFQEESIGADAAAVVVEFHEQQTLIASNESVEVVADYDNCIADEYDGVACVITDFENDPGQVFIFTDPVGYRLAEDAPGPFEYCACEYRVGTVTADEAESRYGEGILDAEGDLLGLTPIGGGVVFDPTAGLISLTSTANDYDLTTEAADVKGDDGDQVDLKLWAGNDGPAGAYGFFDGPGSYALLIELPEGVKVVDMVGGDEWNCFTGEDMASYLGDEVTEERLAELDAACLFYELSPDEDRALPVTVEVTDEDANRPGSVEVIAFDHEGYPGDFEIDTKDNKAGFTLNGGGSGQLPTTGTSLTVIYIAAAAVLLAGVVLIVLGRRRKTAGAVADATADGAAE